MMGQLWIHQPKKISAMKAIRNTGQQKGLDYLRVNPSKQDIRGSLERLKNVKVSYIEFTWFPS